MSKRRMDVFSTMIVEVWWSCGQANNGWSVEQFAGIRQDPSPVAQQVMAFIEDDQANAGIHVSLKLIPLYG